MGKPLRILIIEDSEDDALLLLRELRKGGYDPQYERICTREEMKSALDREAWEIIFSDYNMPRFTAPEALDLLKKSGRDIPFVVFSGSIGEERAVETVKAGAADYLLKDNITRLPVVIERELREADARRARREAEEALGRSQRQIQAILDHTPAVIYIKNVDGRFLLVSRRFEELFGFHRDKVIGKTDAEIFPKEMAALYRANDTKVLSSKSAFEFEEVVRHPDGTVRTYLSIKFPLLDEQNKPYALCGISTDITERKAMEEELRRKRLQAEEASRAKSEFLSNVSHELRTPLNAILGYTVLLLDGTYGEIAARQGEVMESVRRNADDLLNLVNQLLDLTRIESRRLRVDSEPVDLFSLFEEVSVGIKSLFDQKGLTFDCRVPKALPPIRSDYQKIKQVFVNLLSNAAKFTLRGGVKIEASDRRDQKRVEIAVRDTGIGVPSDLLPKIFEPFFQADGSTTRQYGGVGLGLAIVKELLALLGGEIRVESRPGEGATFIVTLPYAPPDKPDQID